MTGLSVKVRVPSNDIAILSVKGFLDAHTFEKFDQSLQKLFEDSIYKIALDFSGVTYISSAGADVLVRALSIVGKHGGKIVIVGPQENTKKVFELLGIDQLFKITSDMDEALEVLG